MIIADSDVLIDALNGIEVARVQVEDALRARRLATTAVNRFELLAGARTPTEEDVVRRLLAPLPTLAFDDRAADLAAAAAVKLARSGELVPMADLAIAGICMAYDAVLLTRNLRHFSRIEGLRIGPLGEEGDDRAPG